MADKKFHTDYDPTGAVTLTKKGGDYDAPRDSSREANSYTMMKEAKEANSSEYKPIKKELDEINIKSSKKFAKGKRETPSEHGEGSYSPGFLRHVTKDNLK